VGAFPPAALKGFLNTFAAAIGEVGEGVREKAG
jgi:hypothetical protein